MDILDLVFLLFLSQDFVSKEAQANNGNIKGELLPVGTRLSKVSWFAKRSQSNQTELQSFDWPRLGSVIEHNRTHPSLPIEHPMKSRVVNSFLSIGLYRNL